MIQFLKLAGMLLIQLAKLFSMGMLMGSVMTNKRRLHTV